jgi:hypothetical protein
MAVCLRSWFGAFAAVVVAAGPALAQFAPPPPPPPVAKPPIPLVPPVTNAPGSAISNPTSPEALLPPVADLTPPEFARPTTVVCDGCRPCDSPAAWLFSADYLLVRVHRRADDFAVVDPADDLRPVGVVQNIGFDLASGLRLGFGYRPAGSLWEAWFVYTYLHAGGNASVAAPDGGLIYPTFTRPGLVDTALVAAAGDNLTYNVYDLDAVRRIGGDESFCFKFGFGFRGTTIDMNQRAFYDGRDANGTAALSRVSFDGAGPTVNGEARWNMPWGLSVFGRAKGGLIVGDVRNSLRETDNFGATTNAFIQDHYYTTIPVLEVGTGVGWQYRNLWVAAGYEVTNWFNLIDSPILTNDFAEGRIGRRHGDLSLEGLFLQLGLAY